jgi:amino acid transporter
MVQGFACGWIYIFGFMVDFANKAVTFSHYMSYWIEENTRNNVLEITLFFLVPILVNVLNVRKYGEVEYWLTAFKLFSILGIILVAFVNAAFRAVDCAANEIGQCLPPPGFDCTHSRLRLWLMC